MNTLARLWRLFDRRQRQNALILLGLMLLGALLEVVAVGALPGFVALLSSPERVLRFTAVQKTFRFLGAETLASRILWAAATMAAFYLAKNAFLSLLFYVQSTFIYNRQIELAQRLYAAYMNSPYIFHLRRNTADLTHNINIEVMRIVADLLIPGLRIAMETLVLIAVLALLITVEPVITLSIMVLLGGSSVLFLRTVRRGVSRFGAAEHESRARMIQTANEGFGGLKDLQVLGRIPFFLRSFATHATDYSRSGVYKNTIGELPRLFLETVAVLVLLGSAALLVAEHRPMYNVVPTLTLLALASVRIMPSANRIVNAAVSVKWGLPALDAVYDDLQMLGGLPTSSELAPISLPGRTSEFSDSIEFRDVYFTYPAAPTEALRGVSFRILKGAAVALVGPSGAGKTTAADILLGLLEPTSGQVLVDGQDIRHNLREWQSQIGYIPQYIYLTDDSIRKNVAFGVPEEEIDDQKVLAALESAQLSSLLASLPDGLATSVGERGIRLSGGQRQRIGIARALYHDPPVLVMDEATSALDYKTESLIIEMIEQLRSSRTFVVIAHRHETVEYFDTVFFLRDGRLVGHGSLAEVIALGA